VKAEDIILEDPFKRVLETQQHRISTGFNIGPAVLVGSAPDNLTRFLKLEEIMLTAVVL
jgi:hypothetical protein